MGSKILLNRKEIRTDEKEDFTVVAYNILADFHIPDRSKIIFSDDEPVLYAYCETEDLYKKPFGRKSKRHVLLMEEIRYLSADVLCLQEVDDWYYAEVLKEELVNLGYELEFLLKEKETKEGLLTAFRKEKFGKEASEKVSLSSLMYKEAERCSIDLKGVDLGHFERDSVGLITTLIHLETKKKLILCNFHAHYDYNYPDVATFQNCLLANEIARYRDSQRQDGASPKAPAPIVFCGDFNTEPTHFGYRVIADGCLAPEDLCHLDRTFYGINRKTCRSEERGRESPLTSFDGIHKGTFDYIFYTNGLVPCAVLMPFNEDEYNPGGPSQKFPSDHISMSTKFRFL